MKINFVHSYRILQRFPLHFNCTVKMSTKSAIVLLAPGAEEMETVISVDVLRRCGVGVTIAGVVGKDQVKCSRDVVIAPDCSLSDAVANGPYDAVVLPGGLGGSKCLVESADVGKILKEQETSGRLIAAICAAPTALKAHKIGIGKSITSYPAVKEELISDYKYCEEKVVIDDNLITSRGPGTAFDFALAIGEKLIGKETTDKISALMLYK